MIPAAIIFDFDGVIVDSFDMHKSAWITAFEEIFGEKFPVVEAESLTGKSSRQIAAHICDVAGVTGKVEDFLQLKTTKVVDGTYRPGLLPGVKKIIGIIRNCNIPYAVASNAPLEYLDSVLTYYEIPVPVTLGFEQVVNPKPAPDLFLLAAEKLKVHNSRIKDVVVFEDSTPGLTAAFSAGMMPIGIRARFSDSEMVEAGARKIYNSLEDVVDSGFLS